MLNNKQRVLLKTLKEPYTIYNGCIVDKQDLSNYNHIIKESNLMIKNIGYETEQQKNIRFKAFQIIAWLAKNEGKN